MTAQIDSTADTGYHLVRCNNDLLFLHAPGISVDLRVELMVPPLPTLLANTALEECGDEAPLTLTILVHKPKADKEMTKSDMHHSRVELTS